MNLQPPTSTPTHYFVLADSHAKTTPRITTTLTSQIMVESISGLKWVDDRQHHLSAIHLIHSPSISCLLRSSHAILLLIGSNSLRIFPASRVLNQVQQLVFVLRQQHPHLVNKNSICIVTTFPCCKISNTFRTPALLQQNIALYNQQLLQSSSLLNITILDFFVQQQHLSFDQLHIHHQFSNLVPNNIFNYFHSLASTPLPTIPRVSCRSADAITRRNRRHHLKLAEKRANFYISRIISPQWTITHVKQYLHQEQIQFLKLSPIRNNQLRIRFNNPHTLQAADSTLPKDIFSSETFSRVFSS